MDNESASDGTRRGRTGFTLARGGVATLLVLALLVVVALVLATWRLRTMNLE